MRSRWQRDAGESAPPVEMRFVDMFMTALGSLIFIALLLVFLLPQTAQPANVETSSLIKELSKLRQELAEQRAKARQDRQDMADLLKNLKEVDKHVVKRWISVLLLTKDCPTYEPAVYVRWEGPVVDYETRRPLGSLPDFDASDPKMHHLVGGKYFYVGPSSIVALNATGPTYLLNGTGLAAISFFTVSNAPGPWSIYIALRHPRALSGRECIVHPIIQGWSGRFVEGTFKLSLAHPFAWIRRVRLENDGAFRSREPRDNAGFLRELEAFSAEQSQKLCERKSICGTRDAHWAVLAAPVPPSEAFDWTTNARFEEHHRYYVLKRPMTPADCEKACLDERQCVAVEHDATRNSCSFYDRLARVEHRPDSHRSVGIRGRSPLRWLVDQTVGNAKPDRTLAGILQEECANVCAADPKCLAVEYFKPTRSCRIFASRPKVLRSPFGAHAPTDVGWRTKH
jgi:hypothetical protein